MADGKPKRINKEQLKILQTKVLDFLKQNPGDHDFNVLHDKLIQYASTTKQLKDVIYKMVVNKEISRKQHESHKRRNLYSFKEQSKPVVENKQHPKAMPRDKLLERAAQLRASISAVLNKDPNAWHKGLDVAKQLESELKNSGYGNAIHSATQAMDRMAADGLINKKREGNLTFYCIGIPSKQNNPIKPTKKSSGDNNALKVDFVKDTGRIRIARGGLTIEIGEE